uniref:Ubiquitin thioesterase OTU n=1 Tax=Prymnesium polylepis TaxID=72548 RepID=A0A7S4N3L6_9EUKA|mmetsp:Transcript_4621/g.10732  ORF Transcript_4621/g.10732 Transcript_4621/m.10732 type:complete len:265 (+) Transcript_4621:27-821(+)
MPIPGTLLVVSTVMAFASGAQISPRLQIFRSRQRQLRGGESEAAEADDHEGVVRSRRGFFPEVFREAEQGVCPSRNSFHIQQVQGTGDCLFHSIAIGMAFEDERCHLDMYDQSLADRVRKLRELAVDTLTSDPNCTLHLEGDQTIAIHELVSAAAEQYDMTPEAYCSSMRNKGVWGGGPEILALANALRRPIHVFEPVAACNGTQFRLQLCGAFGSPAFDECGKRVCIIAADDRFPDCKPTEVKRHGEGGNHFLALLPAGMDRA